MTGLGRWVTAIGSLLALGAGVGDWRGVMALVAGFVVFLVWALAVLESDHRTDNLGRILHPADWPRRRPAQSSRRMTTRTGVGRAVALKPQEAKSSSLPR